MDKVKFVSDAGTLPGFTKPVQASDPQTYNYVIGQPLKFGFKPYFNGDVECGKVKFEMNYVSGDPGAEVLTPVVPTFTGTTDGDDASRTWLGDSTLTAGQDKVVEFKFSATKDGVEGDFLMPSMPTSRITLTPITLDSVTACTGTISTTISIDHVIGLDT